LQNESFAAVPARESRAVGRLFDEPIGSAEGMPQGASAYHRHPCCGQVYCHIAENQSGGLQRKKGKNGVCYTLHHREDLQADALCFWAGNPLDMVGRNPFIGATLPKREQRKRAIWDVETVRRALDACEDDRLYLAIHLAFACSLRFGEICGLTWDCLDISDAAIMNGNAYLKVEKVLARVDEGAVDALGENDIFFTFPAVVNGKSKTRLVLKKPKTESSIRKVWIPVTLARLLRAWKESQDKAKAYLGDAYYDYNLVLTLDNGRPCEDRVIGNAFNRLKRNADLPDAVFHSLRHSSTTYKLKLNHGDIKATQGDTGHAQPDMVTEVYAHILDEDRKVNAQRFEAGFYARADLRGLEQSFRTQTVQQPGMDIVQLLVQLQQNPALLNLLNSLLNTNAS